MNKIVILIIISFLFYCCKSKKTHIQGDNFTGKYYLINPTNNKKYFKFSITTRDGNLFFKEKKKDSKTITLDKFNLNELNSEFYKSLPKNTKIIGNTDNDILLFKTVKDWEFEGFKNKTEFFLMTVVGPISVYKN